MLLAAGVAFWRGWKIHTGNTALLAYGLGIWRSDSQSGI